MSSRPTQIRCDAFPSSGSRCRVTTRKNHVISTDVKIAKQFDGYLRTYPEPDAFFEAIRVGIQEGLEFPSDSEGPNEEDLLDLLLQ